MCNLQSQSLLESLKTIATLGKAILSTEPRLKVLIQSKRLSTLFFVVFLIVSRSGGESEIPDELLITTAAKIGEKDWVPLARELGFTKQEIRDVKKKYPHRSREQVYQMLVLWRHKMGHEATVAALELSTSNARIETLSAES